MSNVLIGIIGVILFIGLALAGALILGDDFKSASNDSQAAALVSQMQQTMNALDMWKLKTGKSTIQNSDTSFLVPRFLKTKAINPTTNGRANPDTYIWQPRFNNDIYADPTDENAVPTASHLMTIIGTNGDAKSRAICQVIADQFGAGVIVINDPSPRGIGCADMGGFFTMFMSL
jgi:hypothetical protein